MSAMTTFTLISAGLMAHTKDLKSLEKAIIINASAEKVWSVLTDFENWKHWNTFIIKSEGQAVVGTKLKNTFNNDGKEMVFKPKVLKVDPGKELVWKGRLILPGIFDGTHGFRIEVLGPNQVRFINYESFTGIFSGMIMKKIHASTEAGFEEMNQALKAEVEQA